MIIKSRYIYWCLNTGWSHFNIKISFVPPVWYPWEGRWSCPRGSHSPAPFPWTKKIFAKNSQPERNLFWVKTFSFESDTEEGSPCREETFARECRTCMALQIVSNWQGFQTTSQTWASFSQEARAPHRTGHWTGLDWTGTLQHNNKDAGLISTTELEKKKEWSYLSFILSLTKEWPGSDWKFFGGANINEGEGMATSEGGGGVPLGTWGSRNIFTAWELGTNTWGENLPRRPSALRMKTLNIRQWKVSNLAFLPDPYWCSMPSFVM